MPKIIKDILRIPNVKRLAAISGFVAIAVHFLASSTSMAGNPGFEQLKGKWVRPDGGYIIDITGVGEDGKLVAKYYNPRSIHVEKAEATQKDGRIAVFIELRDTNYPGSTYRLVYNAEKEMLEGIYFQALERQQFQIYFKRMK
jgi:hypothetical protein